MWYTGVYPNSVTWLTNTSFSTGRGGTEKTGIFSHPRAAYPTHVNIYIYIPNRTMLPTKDWFSKDLP